MFEKMQDMKFEHDWIRRLLMFEPRGHDVMSGAVLTEPCRKDADLGVIFIETGGYLPMCGHDTIGLCTALVETGGVAVSEPITVLRLDTPAGLVKAEIEVRNGKALQVNFQNIPSFLYGSFDVDVEGMGKVPVDIAYGGNFYAIIDADQFGLKLQPSHASVIIEQAVRIRRAINRSIEVVHPESSFIQGVTHVEFFSEAVQPVAHARNCVVVPPGGIDRSPCGTGTSAKLAALYAKGLLGIGEEFVHESIVGSLFRAKVIGHTLVGKLDAVHTTISGSAWLMGMHTFFSHEEDELNAGFLLVPPLEDHN